jgi:hypothetical protein
MDNHKLVMISIFGFFFKNMEKMQFFFNENMLGKFLGFDRMHVNKIFFLFLKREIDLKVFEIFF